jgi:hypothetical protein
MDAAHRRIERGDETARRLPYLDTAHPTDVLVGFTIGHEDELAVVEISIEIEHGRSMRWSGY